MKLKNKLSTLAAASVTTISTVAATPGHDEGTATGMMWGDGGSWMHTGAGMMGYNMWGMGWFGLLFGLAIWTLVILGIIYLYQEVKENKGQEEE